MGGTRGSCVVSSANDMLEMGLVRGVRYEVGVFQICMCFARSRV